MASSTALFPQFTQLNEDLMMYILSFTADAPFANPHRRSALTHDLPLVSKHFYAMSQSDFIWKMLLERLMAMDPLWERGLRSLLPRTTAASISPAHLAECAHFAQNSPSYKLLFRLVVERFLRFTGPVFYMTGAVRLGETFGLHFFEPRYRLLIAEVMAPYPESARQGENIDPIGHDHDQLPTFIYAHTTPLTPSTPACLVQVRQCHIHRTGAADVMLVPVAYVWLERIWERPNSGHLYEAQCLRMGTEASRKMEDRSFSMMEERRLFEFIAREGLGDPPMDLRGPMSAMLSYLIGRRNRGDEEEDEIGAVLSHVLIRRSIRHADDDDDGDDTTGHSD